MTRLYVAITLLILSSLILGVSGLFEKVPAIAAFTIAFLGVVFLLDAGIKLVLETRHALAAVNAEMDFVRQSLGS